MVIKYFPLLAIVFFSCDKLRLDCAEVKYGFVLPVQVINPVDTIDIGDTVHLSVNHATEFIDGQSNTTVNFTGAANLGSAIGFQKIAGTKPQISEAVMDFKIQVSNGQLLRQTSLDVEVRFSEKNSRFLFDMQILALRSGTYRIVLSNSNNTYTNRDKCTKANFSMGFVNTDQHLYMYPGGENTPPGGSTYYIHVR